MSASMQQAGDAAESVASQASEAASSVVDTAKEETRALAFETKDHARELVDEAKTSARHELDAQVGRANDSLFHLSEQFDAMAACSPEPDALPAEMARRVGSGIERVATRIDQQGVDGVVDEVKTYARRNPMVFLVGAAAAGFVVGRVMRNMNHKRMLEVAKDHATATGDTGSLSAAPTGARSPEQSMFERPEPQNGRVAAYAGRGEIGG